MTDPTREPDEVSPARDAEFQDSRYHDEEPEIQMDEEVPRPIRPVPRPKKARRPPPRRHYTED